MSATDQNKPEFNAADWVAQRDLDLQEVPVVGDPAWGFATVEQHAAWRKSAERYAQEWSLSVEVRDATGFLVPVSADEDTLPLVEDGRLASSITVSIDQRLESAYVRWEA